ncbi:MAG: hypothetical protein IKA91_05195 [Bacteroidaceae bacterium]|nr:hypothetical protein [Bacteroidaceae bacterium]
MIKELSLSHLFCNFASAKLLMYNLKHILSIGLLMFATFMIVASSVMPHHHTEDGGICLILDFCNDNNAEHNHGCSDCDSDCAMNIDLMQDASKIGHASKAGLIPQLIAILSTGSSILPDPIELSTTFSFFYVTHAYQDYISLSCGLRAPPVVA